MKKKVFVRFPNESEFLEIMMDMDNFKPEKESFDVISPEIMENYLEEIVILLQEILDVDVAFEEKI